MTLSTSEGFIVRSLTDDRIWILHSDVDANIFARYMVRLGYLSEYVIRRANVAQFETK